MPTSKTRPVKGTDITEAQLASASEFLTALGWSEGEALRNASRKNIALLLAWYGALRYQAAAHNLDSLQQPGSLIETTSLNSKPHQQSEVTFELLEIEDLTVRSDLHMKENSP